MVARLCFLKHFLKVILISAVVYSIIIQPLLITKICCLEWIISIWPQFRLFLTLIALQKLTSWCLRLYLLIFQTRAGCCGCEPWNIVLLLNTSHILCVKPTIEWPCRMQTEEIWYLTINQMFCHKIQYGFLDKMKFWCIIIYKYYFIK